MATQKELKYEKGMQSSQKMRNLIQGALTYDEDKRINATEMLMMVEEMIRDSMKMDL